MIHIHTQHWPFFIWKREPVSSKAIGWMSLVLMISAAATYNAFAKPLGTHLSPFSLVFISEVFTAFYIFLSFGVLPMLRKIWKIERRKMLPLLIIGLTSGTTAPVLWFMGLQRTSAVNATLFANMEMLFLILLAVLFLNEKLRRAQLLPIALVVLGVLLITFRGFSEGFSLRPGDLLLLLASFTYGVADVVFRKYLHQTEPHLVVLFRSLTVVLTFPLIMMLTSHPLTAEIRAFPVELIGLLLGFTFVSRFLNILCFYEALDHLPVTTFSVASNLTILTSAGFASWYLNEPILAYHLIGGAGIVAGLVFLERMGVHPTPEHHEAHLRQRNAQRV